MTNLSGHYKTILPCWKLQFVWLSQQKEPASQLVLVWHVPQHNSMPATRSKVSNGQQRLAEMWILIQIPCLAGWGVATGWGSNSLSVGGAASGLDHLQLPALPRSEQHILCSLLVPKDVYRKALLISISIYLNWNHSWSRSSSAWLTCLYKLS